MSVKIHFLKCITKKSFTIIIIFLTFYGIKGQRNGLYYRWKDKEKGIIERNDSMLFKVIGFEKVPVYNIINEDIKDLFEFIIFFYKDKVREKFGGLTGQIVLNAQIENKENLVILVYGLYDTLLLTKYRNEKAGLVFLDDAIIKIQAFSDLPNFFQNTNTYVYMAVIESIPRKPPRLDVPFTHTDIKVGLKIIYGKKGFIERMKMRVTVSLWDTFNYEMEGSFSIKNYSDHYLQHLQSSRYEFMKRFIEWTDNKWEIINEKNGILVY